MLVWLCRRCVLQNQGVLNMRLLNTLFLFCLISLSLTSCVTQPVNSSSTSTSSAALPESFTTENIMKVHQGMTSKEILSLFGEPKNIRSSVCGMPPNQWSCTTWKYGKYGYGRASFTFSGEHGSLKLNNFDIDRD